MATTNPGSQQYRPGGTQESRPGGMTDFRDKAFEAGKSSSTQALGEKAVEVKEGIREMAGMATDAGREQLDHLKDAAAEAYEEGRDQVQRWQHDLERAIRQQPLTSLIIAAGIGALMGVCWRKL